MVPHATRGTANPLRDKEVFRDMCTAGDSYREEIANKSARAMALFVPEFMELFAVSHSELPALCVLVKGLNKSVVLPLGKDWSSVSLLELLGRISSLADNLPNFQVQYQLLADNIPKQ